jgi:hypothetical protein
MGLACAGLGWMPGTYWDATPHELFATLEARREINKAGDNRGA